MGSTPARTAEKRKSRASEKKLGRKHYVWIIALLVIDLVYHTFFDPPILGHDYRYTGYVVVLPLLFGMGILAYYRREFLGIEWTTSKSPLLKAILTLYYLFQGVFLSFISFVFLAHVVWSETNKAVAAKGPTVDILCKADKIATGRNPGVYFQFAGHTEKLSCAYAVVAPFKAAKASDCEVAITAQKGIWNYYLVKDWTMEANH